MKAALQPRRSARHSRPRARGRAGASSNEALQQTKPGVTSHGPVFAAERWCSTDTCGLRLAWERPRPIGKVPHQAVGPAKLEASLNADGHGATTALVHPVQWRGCNGNGGAHHGGHLGCERSHRGTRECLQAISLNGVAHQRHLGRHQADVMERHV
jgi:hypothetical protein